MTAVDTLADLVRTHLVDNHKPRCVEFIDQLLRVALTTGQVRCSLANERQLRFQMPDQPPWDVEMGRARTKLRMLCARLSVLCNESSGSEVSLYGGEGTILGTAMNTSWASSGQPPQWSVRFKNTPSEHEFTITPE